MFFDYYYNKMDGKVNPVFSSSKQCLCFHTPRNGTNCTTAKLDGSLFRRFDSTNIHRRTSMECRNLSMHYFLFDSVKNRTNTG